MKSFLSGNPLAILSGDDIEKLRELENCKNLDFKKAVKILGLDPARDFRNTDLSGVDLSGCSPEEFDFSGAVADGKEVVLVDKPSLLILDPKGELSALSDSDQHQGSYSVSANANEIYSKMDLLRGKNISITNIKETTSQYYSLKTSDLVSAIRSKPLFRARHTVMYLASEITNKSYSEIGRNLGNRDHTTVIHGKNKIKREIPKDINLRIKLLNIMDQLYASYKDSEGFQENSRFERIIKSYINELIFKDISIKHIKISTAKEFRVRISDLDGARSARAVSLPRQIVMYLSHELTSRTLAEIGHHLGHRSRSSVQSGKARIERLISQDIEIQERVIRILKELNDL